MLLKLEGKVINVVVKGNPPTGVKGMLETWDREGGTILLTQVSDNGVKSDTHHLIPFDNVLWVTFTGPIVVENPPE